MTYIFKRAIEFFEWAPAAGLLLIATTVLAVLANNSFLAPTYGAFLSTPVAVSIGALSIDKPLVLWINDGLMAVFFFLIGLEIKREVLQGQLSSLEKMSLPFIAAVGGMVIPALVFLLINQNTAANINGWAIPAATDIAFALGILALMGTRAPVALKVLLLAIAIIDDLGAVMIIALFYTENLSIEALGLALVGLAGLIALNRAGVKRVAPYVLIGVFMWVCVLKSGVHATLAGVVTALFIPINGSAEDQRSPLKRLEHGLHPWVAFAIVPLFAFANAGVSFAGISLGALLSPLTLGIAAGLFIGKQLGVFGFTFLAVKSGLAKLPEGVNWLQIYSLACLTGIGFTMSLFIGTLAFSDAAMMNEVRLGVLVGSTLSALMGVGLLFASAPRQERPAVVPAE